MTQVIRNNKTILELQEESDYVWVDGDDSALYDAGYEDGINYAINIINNTLDQEKVDMIPSSWLLKVIRHTLQERE
jgi:hypothetical protein